MPYTAATTKKKHCYHCGDVCTATSVTLNDKAFCCEGCKMVYQIINQNELCEYYNLNENPGLTQSSKWRKDKFAFLDDAAIESKLISFKDERQVHVTFYLPQIHCPDTNRKGPYSIKNCRPH
jgi:P-type Cu+ transporter